MIEGLSIAEKLLNVIGWVVGITVVFIVASALISNAFVIPVVPNSASAIIGWSLIVLTCIGIVLTFTTRNSADA